MHFSQLGAPKKSYFWKYSFCTWQYVQKQKRQRTKNIMEDKSSQAKNCTYIRIFLSIISHLSTVFFSYTLFISALFIKEINCIFMQTGTILFMILNLFIMILCHWSIVWSFYLIYIGFPLVTKIYDYQSLVLLGCIVDEYVGQNTLFYSMLWTSAATCPFHQ